MNLWSRSRSEGADNQSPVKCSGEEVEEESSVAMVTPFIGRIELRRDCENEWLVEKRSDDNSARE